MCFYFPDGSFSVDMVECTNIFLLLLVVLVMVVVECKPRTRGNKVKHREKKPDSCVRVESVDDLPDPEHCQEYCVAIRS